LILVFDNEIPGYHMENVALNAPMVGFVAGAIVYEAQLDVAQVSGSGGGAAGVTGLDHNGDLRPIDRSDRDIFKLHCPSLSGQKSERSFLKL
jgi:hypothetical protein